MANEPEKKPSPEEITFQLLKIKLDEGSSLLGHYIRSYAIFLAITGVLLKFALDENATPELHKAMCVFGFLLCLVAFLVCYFGETLRQRVIADTTALSQRLGTVELTSNLVAIRFTVITAAWFTGITAVGWIYLFF